MSKPIDPSHWDENLSPLLDSCSDEELLPLRDYILNANTNELDISELYKQNPDCPSSYVPTLVFEVRTFGGNTLANIARGAGPPYSEIVRDVANQMDVKFSGSDTVEDVEFKIVLQMLDNAKEKMSDDELAALESIVESESGKYYSLAGKGALTTLALQGAIRAGGFAAYQMSVIAANAMARFLLGRGLSFAGNAAIGRTLAVFAGPVGWIASGLWLLADIAGPAMRVTIPCVIHVAMLRLERSATS